MYSFICPYCQCSIAASDGTYTLIILSPRQHGIISETSQGEMKIEYFSCPNCNKVSAIATVNGVDVPYSVPIIPRFLAKQLPDYVPDGIRNDYKEACSIVDLSPKSAATLCRRCLQGIIRDFWKVQPSTLYKEITALKDKVDPDLWASLDSLRKIGNIGAHMESDVNLIIDIDPNEARLLIRLIELLIDEWYVARFKRQKLFSNISSVKDEKENQRQNPTS